VRCVNDGEELIDKVGVIAHIVASVRGVPVEELAEQVWGNTIRLFYPAEV
jgi:TatD DNase family protein